MFVTIWRPVIQVPADDTGIGKATICPSANSAC